MQKQHNFNQEPNNIILIHRFLYRKMIWIQNNVMSRVLNVLLKYQSLEMILIKNKSKNIWNTLLFINLNFSIFGQILKQ